LIDLEHSRLQHIKSKLIQAYTRDYCVTKKSSPSEFLVPGYCIGNKQPHTTTKIYFRSSLSISLISFSLTLQTSGSSTLLRSKVFFFSNLYANTCTTLFNSGIQNSFLKTHFFFKIRLILSNLSLSNSFF